MSSIQELAATLQGLASPGIKRKELVAAIREKHPRASKKDIVRAAFYALTGAVEGDVERAQRLHDFALSERASEDEEIPISVPRRKKNRHWDANQRVPKAH